MKFVATANAAVLPEDTPGDFEFTYVDIGNVTQGSMDVDSPPISFAEAPSRARRLAEPGDTVVSTVRTYLRAVAVVPDVASPLVFSTGFAVLHPQDVVIPRYLSWYLQGDEFVSRIEANSTGVSYPAIGAGHLMSLDLRLPPRAEQQAIADYLDRETAQIDELIAEQQRLIDLVRERRTAVIASAVESIEKLQLRRCGRLITGTTPPTDDRSNFEEVPGPRPWVRPQDLSPRTSASAWLSSSGWALSRPVPAGSVLVGCIAYSLGRVGYTEVPVATNQQITAIVPTGVGKYLYYALVAAHDQLWAASQMNRVPILNNEALGTIRVPAAPIEEQARIAAYLDERTGKADELMAEAARLIVLAQERRSALITAALTGQIDVTAAS